MADVNKPACEGCGCEPQPRLDRRGVLGRLLGVIGGVLGLSALAGCPGGSTYGQKTEKSTAGNVPEELSKLEWDRIGLPDGISAEFKANGKPAYLLHTPIRGQATFTALLRRCPHSGCTVKYSYFSRQLECPCHGSSFDAEGNVLKGPAKKGLTRLDVREEGGKVIVEYPGAYLGHRGMLNKF
jgi:cytochrome b6-f complex iron-sulfur subunit